MGIAPILSFPDPIGGFARNSIVRGSGVGTAAPGLLALVAICPAHTHGVLRRPIEISATTAIVSHHKFGLAATEDRSLVIVRAFSFAIILICFKA